MHKRLVNTNLNLRVEEYSKEYWGTFRIEYKVSCYDVVHDAINYPEDKQFSNFDYDCGYRDHVNVGFHLYLEMGRVEPTKEQIESVCTTLKKNLETKKLDYREVYKDINVHFIEMNAEEID
jgi:hypothetical protein